ncbi:DUF4397 domain-containing protein [Chryseobacterium oranimense]|uniref:DUF4397 domain-containing protein n=1 Tax=Chryseobacterium oranimense TaxID=421058 RepID=UPI0021AEB3AB|nr:DUF4397 domain-containing protein [Chryseobacterium oranimense]UWX61219.1 DUF4397 domain-containing protein [Chryseobacterium oranimense]
MVTILFSCKMDEEVTLPTEKEDFRLNIMASSDVFPQEFSSIGLMYLDHIRKDSVQILGTQFPQRPYPSLPVGNDPNVLYTRLTSGNRKMIFTSVKDSILYEAQHNFVRKGTYNMFIADDMVQDSTKIQYRNVFSDDSNLPQNGKIGIKFINLSPDSGEVTISQGMKDGSKKQLAALAFSQSSPYLFLDEQAIVSNGIIPFSFQNSKKKIFIDNGVAFKQGVNYLIILKGFTFPKIKKDAKNKTYYFDKSLTTVSRIVQS